MGNRILIKQKVLEGNEETTTTGIILTRQEEKKFPMGEVKAIGDKVDALKIGDQVMFEGWNGELVSEELGGEKDLMIIAADKIIAKIV